MTLQTISAEHIARQKEIHARRQEYGAAGHLWAQLVIDIANSMGTKDVLDYGAGKQGLQKSVPVLDIKSYDPAVDEISARPEPADVVVCTSVLPYVEKAHLVDVLKDLQSLTKKAMVAVVSTRKSGKLLDDGESVTQIEWTYMQWLATLADYFDLMTFNSVSDHEFFSVWLPKSTTVQK